MAEMRGVYLITDEAWHANPARLAGLIEAAMRGGAAMLQFRDKHSEASVRRKAAQAALTVCRRYARPLIVNDDIDLAAEIGADGVHLGGADATLAAARLCLGREAIIGISCYGNLDRALMAETQGASYVAFGSFYTSRTKPQAPLIPLKLLMQARECLQLPICAIGGIMADNARPLIDAGADLLAVISAISNSENPGTETEKLNRLFTPDSQAP